MTQPTDPKSSRSSTHSALLSRGKGGTLSEQAEALLDLNLLASDRTGLNTFERHLREIAEDTARPGKDDSNVGMWNARASYGKLLEALAQIRDGQTLDTDQKAAIGTAPGLLDLWVKKYDADIAQLRQNIMTRIGGEPASRLESTDDLKARNSEDNEELTGLRQKKQLLQGEVRQRLERLAHGMGIEPAPASRSK